MRELSDRALVKRVIDGDAEAGTLLATRLACVGPFLRHHARRYGWVVARVDLEDLVQNTLTALLRRLDEYRGDARIETWACSIARFELLRHLEFQIRRRAHEVIELDELPSPIQLETFDNEALSELLGLLPSAAREIARLRHEEGLEFETIARRLEASTSAVKSTYYRALASARRRHSRRRNSAIDATSWP